MMNRVVRWLAHAIVLLGFAGILEAGLAPLAEPARAYEHRKSTPSIGAQIGYGRLVGGEEYYVPEYPLADGRTVTETFDLSATHTHWGPSAHLGVRFVLDRNHALGFGFDDLRYKRKDGYTDEQKEAIPRWVKFTTVHADYYFYFRRRQRVTAHFAPFAGIQQRELRYRGSEVQSQEYKILYGANFGVEYFVRRSFSVDLSGRVFGLRGGSGTNVVVQPALGIHLYVI